MAGAILHYNSIRREISTTQVISNAAAITISAITVVLEYFQST